MMDGMTKDMIERLSDGDEAAAEGIFRACEPHLRAVVRRRLPVRLRSKFDAADVRKAVWGDVLSGFREAGWRLGSADHVRTFLLAVTCNRFLGYRRARRARATA